MSERLSDMVARGAPIADVLAEVNRRNRRWFAEQPDSAFHFPPPAADAPMPTQTDSTWRDPFRAPEGPQTPEELEAVIDHARHSSFMLLPVHGRAIVAELDRVRAELAAVKRGAP